MRIEMTLLTVYISLLVFIFTGVPASSGQLALPKGVNGGVGCAVCSVVVTLAEQLSVVHDEPVIASFERICNVFPNDTMRQECRRIIVRFLPEIIDLIIKEANADVICHRIKLCYTDPGRKACYALPRGHKSVRHRETREEIETLAMRKFLTTYSDLDIEDRDHRSHFDPCRVPGIRYFCALYNHVFGKTLPLVDLDGDKFSTFAPLRGTSWRGRDCDDISSLVYPGRKPRNNDKWFDSNCNGIKGIDPLTGRTYEELFCSDSGNLGTIVLGDSVAAHFHIPPDWLTPTKFQTRDFKNLLFIAENEMDWPMLSAYTGYYNMSRWPMLNGTIDSFYMRLRERNLCNHRDFQNLGKNGADSFIFNSVVAPSIARNQMRDQPALVFYNLIGNDVCNSFPNFDSMTTPEEMYANTLKTMKFLDTVLTAGSHIVIVPLADGRILYDSLKNRYHPIGELFKDLTYAQFYDYFNCLEISPCWGWMNSNETVRNLTTKRAEQLNGSLKKVSQLKFKNFDVHYINNPFMKVIMEWIKAGGKGYELIEPIDGFHPNQKALGLATDYVWKLLEEQLPQVLGKINPHNHLIKKIFGDQGGY